MVLPDLNLLVYAYNESAVEHRRARAWWEGLLNGTTAVGIPWVVSLGFVRLMTHRSVLESPLQVARCVGMVREWFEVEHVSPLEPGKRHWAVFSALVTGLGVGANLVTDAHLAALAIEHNAELHSNDADFARFAGLRCVNPLAERGARQT